ncbi:MAG: hypothetical protein FWF55_08030 [Treponema sp.]|nr:hypothetical protein [Treponema sp.]
MSLKNNQLLIGILLSIFLFACSSPESDGIKAAKKYSDSEHELTELRKKEYSEFIKDFNSYHFKTRIEARRKEQEINDKINVQYNNSLQRADQYYLELSSRYSTNEKRYNVFLYAYNGYRDKTLPADDTIIALMAQIDNLILTIIPPQHDIQNLPNDLIGRKISEGHDGYMGQNWNWEVTSANQVEVINYQNMGNIGNGYYINAQIYLNGEYTDYWADITVYYILRNYDDWTIDVIETKDMHIVQTYKYDGFISWRKRGAGSDYYYFDFRNNSDVTLLIGGVELLVDSGRWKKFSVVVPANDERTIGGWGYPSKTEKISDFEFHFIERP